EHDDLAAREELPVRSEVAALGERLAVERDDRGREARLLVLEHDLRVPPARRAEGHALALALDHEARRHALHATGRETRRDLAPQHRADLVAVEAIEDPSRFLRVD